ncbi:MULTISPECIES: 50S ribosomal protein L15 [Acidithrix]|uniref:Large ribosomal subunit protein uL15 n=1 Tax=Acidithrix ferrooxidans TaxID=1280514 RepID=A0A0D8HKU5_9ACTN|nr:MULTISPECIES: 50S ribosomal protein L15 [Acidithrix]KJF18568.1 50S ribosomal protein L15 [Acidithrix ferrooxidans]CAG4932765.1 unnamed protein product [Acidithrix sp. C25]
MLKLHDLTPAEGSKKKPKRVGRGIGGKGGKTAGRGTKGQGARDTIPMGFEGGQLPLTQRTPKAKGFKNPFKVIYEIVNLDKVAELAAQGVLVIDPGVLANYGIVKRGSLVKILGNGEIRTGVTVTAHKFSRAAEFAIRAAGGSIVTVDLPYAGGRPPVRGNQHANR